MPSYPLEFTAGHLFIELGGRRWLIDTGSPQSFGAAPNVHLAGHSFPVTEEYGGLTSERLSALVGVECHGLLGVDVLDHLDLVFRVGEGKVEVSGEDLALAGVELPLTEFLGIPVLKVNVRDQQVPCFFDTGAQISYLQESLRTGFPDAGVFDDFLPGFGEFTTSTRLIRLTIGGLPQTIRAGTPPRPLAATLMMAGVQGVVGNEIMKDRTLGYFPRRERLVLA